MSDMTFTKALVEYLELDRESLSDFRHQIAQLTPADKNDLRQWFGQIGVNIIESPSA